MNHSQNQISVAIAGANGKMGKEAVMAISSNPQFKLVAVLVRSREQVSETAYAVYDDPSQLLMEQHPDVWLDFTDADSVVDNIDRCIAFGVRPVVGATGYTPEDVERWNNQCLANQIGGIAAPNFAIGALLMMRFAAEAARFYDKAEIVEFHHDRKKDAPSGTAKRTAEQMEKQRQEAASDPSRRPNQGQAPEQSPSPARGLLYGEVPIHSVRLPGLVAHQEVIFGGTGEVLTIRHDSLSRASFMPGVVLACSKVMELQGMVYGLEHLLW